MAKEKINPSKVNILEEEFAEKVIELKKLGKEKLLEIIQIQPFNHELRDFLASRKALDELKVEYPMNFKVKCEERDTLSAFGKKIPENPIEKESSPETGKSEETKKKD